MRTSPLSAFQAVYWRHERRRPGSPAVVLRAFDLEGPLDVDMVRRAVDAATRRHDALRSRFVTLAGEPVQAVEAAARARLEVLDLGQLDPREHERRVRERELHERVTPFELHIAPLWRFVLLRLSSRRHVLLVAAHHLVADGWSMSVLATELSEEAAGRTAPPDWAQLVAAARESEHHCRAAARRYWGSVLRPLPPRLPLPLRRPRSRVRGYRGERLEFDWPASLADQLRAAARRHRASPFMVLLSSFLGALRSATGQQDLVVGSLFAGRDRPGTEAAIGLLARPTVLRVSLHGDPSGSQVLSRVRDTVLDAHEHSGVEMHTVVGEIFADVGDDYGTRRESGDAEAALTRLWEVWFNVLPDDTYELPVSGAVLRPRPTCAYPVVKDEGDWDGENLTLTVTATRPGLRGHLDYNGLLLTGGSARSLLTGFRESLGTLLEEPERRLSDARGAAVAGDPGPPPTPDRGDGGSTPIPT